MFPPVFHNNGMPQGKMVHSSRITLIINRNDKSKIFDNIIWIAFRSDEWGEL